MTVMVVETRKQMGMIGFAMEHGFLGACECCAAERQGLIDQGIVCPHPNPGMEGKFTLSEAAVSVLFYEGHC